LTAPVGGFAKLVTPVDFEALDEQPCDLVFMLLAPKESSADHLRALARISRVFRQARLRQAIREAPNSKDALIALLTQPLQSDAA
jgi:PTS system nitrogen regulatory IIA component